MLRYSAASKDWGGSLIKKFFVIYFIVFLAVFVACVSLDVSFLPSSIDVDGFSAQISHVSTLIQDESFLDAAADSWLLFLHLMRLVAVAPFLFLESIAGSGGSIVLLLLLMLPLTHVPGQCKKGLVTLIPMALPFLVSGRSVLVAIGVGYIIMHQIERRRVWMLAIGVLLVNLSSASVLMSFLFLAFGYVPVGRRPRGPWIWQRMVAILLLAISLAISVQVKLAGFAAGETGYEATIGDSDNIFVTILSRSTLFVSFSEGQHIRSIFYSIVALFLLVKLLLLMATPRLRTARRIILCCVPGIFLEGLGVLGMTFPLIWLFAGFEEQAITSRSIFVKR